MNKRIAIAGTLVLDEIKEVERYPDKSELTAIRHIKQSMGGLVANCALGLSKIDPSLAIELVALIGEDARGDFLKQGLAAYDNIDRSKLKKVGETAFTDVIQDSLDKSRTFFTYKGNSVYFDEDFLSAANIDADLLHIGYILLLDGLDAPDQVYGTKLARFLKEAQERGIKTSIDVVSENSNRYEEIVPPSLKYTNYCIINELEAGSTLGIALRDSSGRLLLNQMKEAALRLKDLGVQDWVIIHAPEGSVGFDGQLLHKLPSIKLGKSEIRGTVGAGDAYTSGVLYGALRGDSLPEAMELGTAAAATSLLAEDSTSGIRTYGELRDFYRLREKNVGWDL